MVLVAKNIIKAIVALSYILMDLSIFKYDGQFVMYKSASLAILVI